MTVSAKPVPFCPTVSVHPTAICDAQSIGEGTSIWAFAHIMEDAIVGEHCNVCDHVFIESGAVVGSRVTIKNNALIWEGVTIEDDVFIGPGVIFTNDQYPRSRAMKQARQRYSNKDNWLVSTLVQKGASIGAGAIILGGAEIGRFASVAAGSVVTKNVPDHGLVMGNPARLVGKVCTCGAVLQADLHCPQCEQICSAANMTS